VSAEAQKHYVALSMHRVGERAVHSCFSGVFTQKINENRVIIFMGGESDTIGSFSRDYRYLQVKDFVDFMFL